jgi:hypothetical protein
MSTKHFKSIARVLNLIPDATDRAYITREMYRELKTHNPRIDWDKFSAACGV